MNNRTRSKKSCALFIVISLMLTLLPGKVGAADHSNLLGNSGFEQVAGGVPDTWSQDMWLTDEGASKLWMDSREAHTGTTSAAVENIQPNHARWIQKLTVLPNTYYKISGWIKTENIPQASGGSGANLFVSGVSASYPEVYNTNGSWQQVEFTGVTGAEQTELTIGAGLGQYGALTTGTAYFDDISVVQTVKPSSLENVISMDTAKTEKTRELPVSVTSTVLMLAVFSLFFAYMYRIYMRKDDSANPDLGRFGRRIGYTSVLFILLAAGLVVRLWSGLHYQGYTGDLTTFTYWAERLKEKGFSHFYEKGIFADYPPGYLYVLYILGAVKSALGLADASAGTRLLLKLPSILADLAAGYFLYRLGRRNIGERLALALAFLYVFNPAVWIDSSNWGQIDGFFALFLVLFLNALAANKPTHSAVWFAIAALIKPQAFIFAPVVLLYFIFRRSGWKSLLLSFLYGTAVFLLLASPFFWSSGGVRGLYELYRSTLSSYPYAVLNAFNLFSLVGGNWKPLNETWGFLTFRTWGNLFLVLSVAVTVLFAWGKGSFAAPVERQAGNRSRGRSAGVFLLALILITCVYLLGPKMHERYLFPALLIALFAFIELRDRRLLLIFFGFSITQYVNIDYVLKNYHASNSATPIDGIAIVSAIVNLAFLAYLLAVGWDILFRGRIRELAVISAGERRAAEELTLSELTQSAPSARAPRMQRKDWMWTGAITLLYAVIALYHLGDMKSPVTYWETSAAGESFYVDLGSTKSLGRINLFAGPGRGVVKIEFSNTPDNWDHATELDLYGKVFKWNTAQSFIDARYVKFTAESPETIVHEIAIYTRNSKEPLPVTAIQSEGLPAGDKGSPDLLFDEPDRDVYTPSYMNSTYFDEIYHPRTAYEYLQGMPAYENTHPPLGKILIALGIKLFGLSPFGWRIVGTVFGIGMLPLMYRMALTMFGRSRYAVTATLLFALDFMHFTQTRMATIDSYAVFFLMVMYYFMHRYMSQNFYTMPVSKTLIPLGLAGLFFGIGAASKWNVAYGGAGLAVMLGMYLYARYREMRAARRWLNGQSEEGASGTSGADSNAVLYRAAASGFIRSTLITLSSCVLFFLIIPAIIYSLSFIPVLKETAGGYTLKNLIDAQIHMYDYHSQLTATHPYSSQWWQWPFMKRPLWLYNGPDMASGMKATMVTMGNPLIWWTGIFAILLSIWVSLKRRDKYMYTVWIAYLSVYIPWVLVPRYTFIYHYFTMVPFMIISIVYIMKLAEDRYAWFKKVRISYILLAAFLFVLFYPALTGLTVSKGYIDYLLRWFPTWDF
ncbi:glycosyltransferase family 39 protein [Paenibacillus pinistramenti]|uniref:glycosyltransferase family 39 protein n=1 Tax=Paenibacillus pinistramenti TaxID=1768003 RepID=UPI001109A36F|nr:glycosyltransferase family 39 protein [Paenibacillus pinistramenti]